MAESLGFITELFAAVSSRTNACINPACKNNVTGYGGGSTPTRSTTVSGSGVPRTTGATYTANGFSSLPAVSAAPGQTWTLSLYFINNTGSALGTKAFYLVSQRSAGGDDFGQFTNFALPTGVTRLVVTKTTPANTTGLYAVVDSFNGGSGTGCDITGVLYEQVGSVAAYGDGDSSGGVWLGTNGNSASTFP